MGGLLPCSLLLGNSWTSHLARFSIAISLLPVLDGGLCIRSLATWGSFHYRSSCHGFCLCRLCFDLSRRSLQFVLHPDQQRRHQRSCLCSRSPALDDRYIYWRNLPRGSVWYQQVMASPWPHAFLYPRDGYLANHDERSFEAATKVPSR